MSSSKADISEDFLATSYPEAFSELLSDKTTDSNIIWACDDYAGNGEGFSAIDEITVAGVTGDHGDLIQPRTYKEHASQHGRQKDKAEVFTPSWVVNLQNNAIDKSWFGRADVFNTTSDDGKSWVPTTGKIAFPDTATNLDETTGQSLKTWQSYVREPRLEITCGEGPYLASRYDAATGKPIAIENRVGLLDRKLRVIEENVPPDHDHEHLEWMEWVRKAYQATYGFEWQGDNLLLARENLLFTFFDAHRSRYGCDPESDDLTSVAEIIAWNIFQMDGLTCCLPMRTDDDGNAIPAKIMDWESGQEQLFSDAKRTEAK